MSAVRKYLITAGSRKLLDNSLRVLPRRQIKSGKPSILNPMILYTYIHAYIRTYIELVEFIHSFIHSFMSSSIIIVKLDVEEVVQIKRVMSISDQQQLVSGLWRRSARLP